MEGFEVKQIGQGAYSFLDAGGDSFYLVIGQEKAAVIDTGITRGGRILPLLRELTDKPLELILTHVHIDHIHHMDEFQKVYMSHKEFALPKEVLEMMKDGKNLDLEGTIHVETGSTVDLGGRVLEICDISGHSPGSIAIYDPVADLVFTGDAIGSGCGVWMQLVGSCSLTEYEKNLRFFMAWLIQRGGAMEFWGGHSHQYTKSRHVPGYNPLSMGLLADLIDLTRKVRLGHIVGDVTRVDSRLRKQETRYAAYGRAELLYAPENL